MIEAKYEYPFEHQTEMSQKYRYIHPSIWFGMEYRQEPVTIKQLSLFPQLQDLFIDELPSILKRGKQQSTQIKWLAKKYNVPIPAAKKAYQIAMSIVRATILYEDYCRFKDYFDWKETPEFHEYCRQYFAEHEARLTENHRIFDEKVTRGEEHIISIDELDPSLNNELDRDIDAYQRSQAPASWLANHMTRHDFEILHSRGLIDIVMGNPETVKNHPFITRWEREITLNEFKSPIVTCECGEVLDYNLIGLNKKLGAHNEKDFKCLACLEMSEEEAQNLIDYYKDGGCNLFI